MTFDKAFKAITSAEWDWSPDGFEKAMKKLGATRKTKSKDMPIYKSPWGAEAQAIIDKTKVRRVEFFFDVTMPKGEFDYEEMDQLAEDYAEKFADYRTAAEKLLGKPAKTSGERLQWKLPTAKLTLASQNAGPETPFWISLVLTK